MDRCKSNEDYNLNDRSLFEKALANALYGLKATRFQDEPAFVCARTMNGHLACTTHADNDFMFTLIVALSEKVCSNTDTNPTHFCLMLLEQLVK